MGVTEMRYTKEHSAEIVNVLYKVLWKIEHVS